MFSKIKTAPRVVLGLGAAAAAAYFVNQYIDSRPKAPTAIETLAAQPATAATVQTDVIVVQEPRAAESSAPRAQTQPPPVIQPQPNDAGLNALLK